MGGACERGAGLEDLDCWLALNVGWHAEDYIKYLVRQNPI